MRGVILGFALLCLPVVAFACAADEPITIHAENERLSAVVKRLAERCGIEVRARQALDALVSVAYEREPAGRLLHRLLRQHSHILTSDVDGRPRRLFVFGNGPIWRTGPGRDTSSLRAELTDANAERRMDAVLSLADLTDRDYARLLLKNMENDPDPGVRAAAEAALDALTE